MMWGHMLSGRRPKLLTMKQKPMRLTREELFADILVDRRSAETRYIYIVQRVGSAEILSMGSYDTEAECIQMAKGVLSQMTTNRHRSASGE